MPPLAELKKIISISIYLILLTTMCIGYIHSSIPTAMARRGTTVSLASFYGKAPSASKWGFKIFEKAGCGPQNSKKACWGQKPPGPN